MSIKGRNKILDEYERTIRSSMARALWLNAYASYAEEPENEDDEDIDRPGPGEDWNDFAPETPKAADQAAAALVKLFVESEGLHGKHPMADLFALAIEADTGRPYSFDELIGRGAEMPLPSEFGFTMAMEALGTGVSWTDSHKNFEPKRISFECNYIGGDLMWSGRTMTNEKSKALHASGNTKVFKGQYLIRTSFETVTPGEDGDEPEVENGWENEEGETFTTVSQAIRWMEGNGPFEPSSSSFHRGIWYTHYGEADWRTGETTNLSYHLEGFSERDERRVYGALVDGRSVAERRRNPPGLTEKGERMYEDIKAEYEAKGDPRAKEIAARTVYARAKETPGLLKVGMGRPPGVPNPGRRH